MESSCDVAIAGAGVVGCAVARALLLESPTLHVIVFEKEAAVALHQSGRNSGVIHSGTYYRPGSLKARLAVDGAARMRRFCEARALPLREVG
jgi:L-2-hydroxyglutarate oxidase